MGRRAPAGITLVLAASVTLLAGGAFWKAIVGAATNWDTVVTPVASSYLSLRADPPFADDKGLATFGPRGVTPGPATSSDFGDWEARYNYYPASQQAPCDASTYNAVAGCAGVNPYGHDLSTLDAWLSRFNFPRRLTGETLDAYRRRAKIAIYYNVNELGLGRELGCSTFEDKDTSGGILSPSGIACYVTNYGEAINDPNNALTDAIHGQRPKNTVCISYQPSLPPGYQVNFATFDGQGRRADTAQLDYMGKRPVPGICMNCHGGVYDPSKHLVQGGRFLPPNIVGQIEFGASAPYRQSDQNEAFRSVLDLIYRTDLAAGGDVLLTQYEREAILLQYGIMDPNSPSIPVGSQPVASTPPSWRNQPDLYRHVILPYCGSCHNALSSTGNPVAAWKPFKANWKSQRAFISDFHMPHSQVTLSKFWGAALTVDGTATGQPVLLAPDGTPWKSARNFLVYTMEHGSRPNPTFQGPGCTDSAQCGDVSDSGRSCVNGSCRDQCGSGVGCPGSTGMAGLNVQECRDIANGVGVCVSCGRLGQSPCAGGICNEGTNVNGVCL